MELRRSVITGETCARAPIVADRTAEAAVIEVQQSVHGLRVAVGAEEEK